MKSDSMSEELVAAIQQIRDQNLDAEPNLTLEQMRANMEERQQLLPLPDDVAFDSVTAGSVPAEWVTAPNSDQARAVIYFHGGGYVMGSVNTHREFTTRIAKACKTRVLSVDYRLAPEHPFPAAIEDGVASFRWLLEQDIDASKIVMAGDSAGGGLTLSTLIKLRDEGTPLPVGGMLLSPWTDLAATGESTRTRAELDPMIAPDELTAIAQNYHVGNEATDPLVSPLYADLMGLPELLVQVGGAEILYDDSTRLAANALKQGVSVDLQEWEHAFHVFQAFPGLPESAAALDEMGKFFERVTS